MYRLNRYNADLIRAVWSARLVVALLLGREPAGRSDLVPSQLRKPRGVSAQCRQPSVNDAVSVNWLYSARPVVVCWMRSLTDADACTHSTGAPIVSPSCCFRAASLPANAGD